MEYQVNPIYGNNISYVHGPNIDEPLSAEIRRDWVYYHADGLGSITALTSHMGNVVQKYDYDSFGNMNLTPKWIKQPYTYTGREFDPETGLYYYRARYYDAKVGRFITTDPIGFRGGINQYVYAKNNPLRYLDSYGLWNIDVHLVATYLIAENIPAVNCHADAIAAADQAVDDDSRGPMKPWFMSQQAIENRRLWHFPEPGRIDYLLAVACRSCRVYDIGGMLHVAQDSIAHAGYGYVLGHFPDTSVDDISRRPLEAQRTYSITRSHLFFISIMCDEIRN